MRLGSKGMEEQRSRDAVLREELKRYVSVIARNPDTVGIVLFGSMASGPVDDRSDIDLLVLMKTQLPFLKRILALQKVLQPKVALDLLVYAPQELATLYHNRPFVRDEIIERGKILYERERGAVAALCA